MSALQTKQPLAFDRQKGSIVRSEHARLANQVSKLLRFIARQGEPPMDYPLPQDERQRQAAVKAYGIYGSEPETAFDDLTELAAHITQAPIALVHIVGDDNVWVKSRHGVPADHAEAPRGAICCAHTICQADLLCVPDTHADDRFKGLPFISTEPFVRFYAGMPLINSGGYALGTLCIMDLQPRELEFEVAEGIRRLARQTVAQLELRLNLEEMRRTQEELGKAKARSEELIHNILPVEIATELAETGAVEPRHHHSVSILFTDFAGFTKTAETMAPRALVDDLHRFFCDFDDVAERHGLEKLKTIGDAYMCVAGLANPTKDDPVRACLVGLEILHKVEKANAQREKIGLPPWQLRIGIHTGSVMSGVVGRHKFAYDIWGDSVNIASRMESSGAPGHLNVSEGTYERVKDYFICEGRGRLAIKNRGDMNMYFVSGLKPEFASDNSGWRANDSLVTAVSGVTKGWTLS